MTSSGTDAHLSRTKRQHYLPRGYLKAWADDFGRVAARKRAAGPAFVTHTRNVALEANLYSINMGDYWDDSLEQALSEEVENDVPALLDELRRERVPRRGTQERRRIAQLVAIQHARTPAVINQGLFSAIAREAIGHYPMTHSAMRHYLTGLYGKPPTEGEVQGALDFCNYDQRCPPTKADVLSAVIAAALEHVAPHLEQRAWHIEVCHKARFVTTDRPIALWAPNVPTYRGLGLEGAYEVRFPLGPRHLLVLGRGSDDRYVVDHDRATVVNEHLIRGCHRLLLAHPDDKDRLNDVRLPDHGPELRFNTGPEYAEGPNGQLMKSGREILHMYYAVDDTA